MSTHGAPPPGDQPPPVPPIPPTGPAGGQYPPPPPPPQYTPPPPTSQLYGQQGGFADQAAQFARRHLRTPETKEFFKTSEFLTWGLTILAVLIAANAADDFGSAHAWTLVTVLSFGYIISRGISKAGTRRDPEPDHERRGVGGQGGSPPGLA